MALGRDQCGCLVTLLVLASVFFIIALPTYLMGCNDTLYPAGCAAYFVQSGVVSGSRTDAETCQSCQYVGKNLICIPYTCYGAFVDFGVCEHKIGTYGDTTSATNAANAYDPGASATLYRLKSDPSSCTDNTEQVTVLLPRVGIAFFVLFGLAVLAALSIVLYEAVQDCQAAVRFAQRHRHNVYPTPTSSPPTVSVPVAVPGPGPGPGPGSILVPFSASSYSRPKHRHSQSGTQSRSQQGHAHGAPAFAASQFIDSSLDPTDASFNSPPFSSSVTAASFMPSMPQRTDVAKDVPFEFAK